ncbi:MAG: glycosyltransferase family 2 protein [Rickettsiales bacterium]|nr:glycosyltransferase family 2 protein [Rickettsiales bacterium]
MKLPLSVTIITKNEEERLPYTLKSVQNIADEIILVDSGSTDKTLQIAKEFNCKIFHKDWNGYGEQKIFAEEQTKNNWILNLDADEELSESLRENIIKLFQNSKIEEFPAYKMFWQMLFLGQEKPPIFAVGSNFVRLYNKEKAGFSASKVHDSVLLKTPSEKLGILQGYVYHRCFKSMKHWAEKINSYSTLQAEDWVKSGRKPPTLARMIFEPIFAFLKSYFLRRYFIYGVDGYFASIIYAYAKMLRLAKVRELFKNI